MTIPYLEVLAGIAMALSILMAGAWLVQVPVDWVQVRVFFTRSPFPQPCVVGQVAMV